MFASWPNPAVLCALAVAGRKTGIIAFAHKPRAMSASSILFVRSVMHEGYRRSRSGRSRHANNSTISIFGPVAEVRLALRQGGTAFARYRAIHRLKANIRANARCVRLFACSAVNEVLNRGHANNSISIPRPMAEVRPNFRQGGSAIAGDRTTHSHKVNIRANARCVRLFACSAVNEVLNHGEIICHASRWPKPDRISRLARRLCSAAPAALRSKWRCFEVADGAVIPRVCHGGYGAELRLWPLAQGESLLETQA